MLTNTILPVILSGGVGTRLWPLSREAYPKQMIALYDQHSLLQNTLLRLAGLEHSAPIVVCNHEHRFLVAEQLRAISVEAHAIVLEPFGRNTAPAIAVAALHAAKVDPKQILLVLPADHLIQNEKAFQAAVLKALPLAKAGKLVTFGIVPTFAHTGYGYIRRGKALSEHGYQVDQFVEKPDRDKAESYIKTGDYYWNSGMFMFSAETYLKALAEFAPEVLSACQEAVQKEQADLDFLRLEQGAFAKCPAIAVDYAVMEKAHNVAVLPMDATWSDVGSWSALCEVGKKDGCDNVTHGDVLTHNVTNSYVRAESRLLAAVGVSDLVMVETQDAVLVAHKDASQEVKNIVDQLVKSGRKERLYHTSQYRPWGHQDLLFEGPHFQVSRVFVHKGAHISLQRHAKRSEHWVIVSGAADILADGVHHTLLANQSFYVPIGMVHSISNPGPDELVFIEVQVGECLKDDDIERVENG